MTETLEQANQAPVTQPYCTRCESRKRPVLDLGDQPLANALLAHPDDPAPAYPLRLGLCASGHLQLMDPAPPDALFTNYLFRTGASAPARLHFAELAREIAHALPVSAQTVCEVGSNDGTLLTALHHNGLFHSYGVDPSSVAADVPHTENVWFSRETAMELRARRGTVDAVVLCNVLAHCPDPQEPILAARDLLDEGGLLVIEVPYLFDLLARGAYDTIYHEHVHYFSVRDLWELLLGHDGAGFAIYKIERLPVHGGSLRIWARKLRLPRQIPWPSELAAFLAHEPFPAEYDWEGFADRVERHRIWLRGQVEGVGVLAGYGAPAKACVLLNHAGIRPAYVTDTTPDKIGRYIPGVRVPIRGREALLETPPDRVLLLAWNYADAIKAREPELAGRWIVPFRG
jgi:SAM-dependent methyltransferase